MLKKLSLRNFTAFGRADLEFSNGLNVIIGENATGKTHLLKMGYLLSTIWDAQIRHRGTYSKEEIERYISEKLTNTFKPEKIGNLTRSDSDGKSKISGIVEGAIPTVSITIQGESPLPPVKDEIDWGFHFSNLAKKKINIDKLPKRLTSNAIYGKAIYIPSKEMISFFEGFLSLYETHELQFDETFRDLALALSSPKLKDKPELLLDLLTDLSDAVGGGIILAGGRFYTVSGPKDKRREITLLAEGLRKLATIMQLIENGSLKSGDKLFWDEPEANLNPRLTRLTAHAIHKLAANNVQVFIATHSYFLLKELDLLFRKQPIEQTLFGLSKEDDGVHVESANKLTELKNIVALDEELAQYDREMELANG